MRIATLQNPVSMDELHQMAGERFGDMVKAVVDLRQGIMVLGAEMHADEEAELLFGNSSRGVDDSNTQKQIKALVQQLVQR